MTPRMLDNGELQVVPELFAFLLLPLEVTVEGIPKRPRIDAVQAGLEHDQIIGRCQTTVTEEHVRMLAKRQRGSASSSGVLTLEGRHKRAERPSLVRERIEHHSHEQR